MRGINRFLTGKEYHAVLKFGSSIRPGIQLGIRLDIEPGMPEPFGFVPRQLFELLVS